MDGVGGAVKRQVRAEVMTRREVVKDAEKYSEVAEKCCPNIKVIFLPKKDVEGMRGVLDDDAFVDSKVLPGTRKMHHIEVTGPGEVLYTRFKGSNKTEKHKFN